MKKDGVLTIGILLAAGLAVACTQELDADFDGGDVNIPPDASGDDGGLFPLDAATDDGGLFPLDAATGDGGLFPPDAGADGGAGDDGRRRSRTARPTTFAPTAGTPTSVPGSPTLPTRARAPAGPARGTTPSSPCRRRAGRASRAATA